MHPGTEKKFEKKNNYNQNQFFCIPIDRLKTNSVIGINKVTGIR